MPEPPTTKPEVMRLIHERWAALQELLGRLSEADMERPLGDGWSAKQHVFHVTVWEKSLLGLLRKEDRGRAMGVPADLWAAHDLEGLNKFLAEDAAPRSVSSVLAEAADIHGQVLALLDSMSQEQLELPYSDYQPFDSEPNEKQVIGWVHGDTWEHYDEHIGWLEAGLRA